MSEAGRPDGRDDGADASGPSRRTVLRRGVGAAFGLGLAGVVSGCGTGLAGVPGTASAAAPSSLDPYFPGHGTGGLLVNHYALDLTYAPATGLLSGTATVRILPFMPLNALSLDFSSGMDVSSVQVNGVAARFSRNTPDKIDITPAMVLGSGVMATLRVAYSGTPQPVTVTEVGQVGWQQLEGAGQASGAAVSVASLPIGAPTWFPCEDHPTLKASYQVSITVPSQLTALSNGKLTAKTSGPAGTTWTYQHPGPMASYLATVQIGEFLVETEQGPKGVQIRNAYPPDLATAARYDFGRQSQMLSTFVELFGAYPFEAFGTAAVDGLPQQHYGAETLGLIQAALVDGKRTNEELIARNLAQQWFGGAVSPASWRDIWLNSAFALYGGWLWVEKSGGKSANTQAVAAMQQLAGYAADLIVTDPGANRIVDPRVSLRGACFLHALRDTMGDEVFFQLLQLWVNRFQGAAAQTADFIALIPSVYQAEDLTDFVNEWINTARLPQLPHS